MGLSHKAGSDYGIDHGVLAVLFLWVIAIIVLVIVLVVRTNAQNAARVGIGSVQQSAGWLVMDT